MRVIKVTASGSYDVLIGSGILDDAGKLIADVKKSKTAVVVSDDNVFPLYGKRLEKSLKENGFEVLSFVFPAGEQQKNLDTYGDLLETMCEAHVTRKDLVVALGGGVVGDLAGFAAATYQRGIAYVQIPTTLLAAVDSSVGGKTAVDLKAGKNQAGAFHQPSLVICDIDLLDTLPEEQYLCGCAEVIKYGMIEDAAFFESLNEVPVKEQYEKVIEACVNMKADYVAQDEFDTGVRMLLNFGHTFGHAAEALSGYEILHGQGVAAGMAIITKAAEALRFCSAGTYDRLVCLLRKYGLPEKIDFPAEDVLKVVLSDKKATGNTIRLIVPEDVGRSVVKEIPVSELANWAKAGGIS